MLDRSIPPKTYPLGRLSMPEPEKTVLENGVEMSIYDAGPMPVCELSVYIGGGLLASQSPAALLASQMFLEGTRDYSANDIAETLEFNGIQAHPFAQAPYWGIKFTGLSERFIDIIPLLRQILSCPSLPKQKFDIIKEKEAVKIEIARKKVSVLAEITAESLTWGNDNLMARAFSPEEVRNVTLEETRQTLISHLTTSNFHVYLGGLITPELRQQLFELFSTLDLPKGIPSTPPIPIPTPAAPGTVKRVHLDGAVQSAIVTVIPSIGRTNPDYIPLRILVIALGGYFGSRLMANIREDKGYTYGIYSALLGYADSSAVTISTQCDNAYVDEVLQQIRIELSRLADPASYTDDEIERLRSFVMTVLAEEISTPFSIIDHSANRLLSATPEGYFDQQQMWIHKLTPENFTELARRYLNSDRMLIAIAGPQN